MLIHGLGLRILVNGLHTGVHASSKGEGYLESSIGFRAHGNVAISLQSAYIHTDTHRNSVLNTEKCVKITLKRPTSSDVGSDVSFSGRVSCFGVLAVRLLITMLWHS